MFKTKKQKYILIGVVAFILIGSIILIIARKKAQKDLSNSISTDTNETYEPGTPLQETGTDLEATELQERYAGMEKETIIADYIQYRFNNDAGMLQHLEEKRGERSLEEQKRVDAIYLLNKCNVPGF